MAAYDSSSTVQPGQWPATDSFTQMGLPAQDYGTGAAGSAPIAGGTDAGHTVQPGEYPAAMPFAGSPLPGGTGAPGTAGVPPGTTEGGADSVTYTQFDAGYKDSRETAPGEPENTHSASVGGTSDWTQANGQSYGGADQYYLPGIQGNMPQPGSGRFTSGGTGRVLHGGNANGQRS